MRADLELEIVLLRAGGWTKCSSDLPANKYFNNCRFFLSQSGLELCLTSCASFPGCKEEIKHLLPYPTGARGGDVYLQSGMKM